MIDGFVIVTNQILTVFSHDKAKNQFRTSYLYFHEAENYTTTKPTCAISLLADYKNKFFKHGNQDRIDIQTFINRQHAGIDDAAHTLKHLVITGHEDGKVLIWRL